MGPIAEKHGLVMHAFRNDSSAPVFEGEGYVQLIKKGPGLPPAPHTPTEGPVWDVIAGTARHVLKDERYGDVPYIITPFAMIGNAARQFLSLLGERADFAPDAANTDTASYWNLTKSIFRYPGGPAEDYARNLHS